MREQFILKDLACVLEASIRVVQRMRIWIFFNGFIEGIKYKQIVISKT